VTIYYGRDLLFERDDDMSDEEIYSKRLGKSLTQLKITYDSIIGVSANDLNFEM
jgi:hypothetical protein